MSMVEYPPGSIEHRLFRTLTPEELAAATLLSEQDIRDALEAGRKEAYLARESVMPHGGGRPEQLYR